MVDQLESLGVSLKWKRCRDSVRALCLATDKANGLLEYKKKMKLLQTVIKGVAKKHDLEFIEATTIICDIEEDKVLIMNFLAAGYELVSGYDFTNKNTTD